MTLKSIQKLFKVGQDYTLVTFNAKGYPQVQYFVLEKFTYKVSRPDYVLFIVKGSRALLKWDKFIRLNDNQEFIVYDKLVQPEINPIIADEPLGPHTTTYYAWLEFDSRYLTRAINSVQVPPLAFFVKQPTEPEKIKNYKTVSRGKGVYANCK